MSTIDALIADALERQQRGDNSWPIVADHYEENGDPQLAQWLRVAAARGHEIQRDANGGLHAADGRSWDDGPVDAGYAPGLRHFQINDGGGTYHRLAKSGETVASVVRSLSQHPEYRQPGWTVAVSEIGGDGEETDSDTYESPISREVD